MRALRVPGGAEKFTRKDLDGLPAVVADRYARTGRFRLPMDIPGQAAPVPGLMTGVAGIAAHLLSVSTGGDLRAFLL